MKKILCVVFVSFLMAGCQSLPPLNFSVPDVGVSQTKLDAEIKSITVTLARPDEKKGDLPMGSEEIPEFWETALEEALNRMVIFKDEASKRLSLSVKILAVNIPSFGFEMETTSIARYELIDRANGDIVYTQEISASGVTPLNFAFAGIVRARESINRSVQNNIASFLQALETVDIHKPMFPSAQSTGQEQKS